MAKRTEQQERHVEEVVEFCRENREALENIPKLQFKLDYVKKNFPDVALDIVLKGLARWLRRAA